MQTNCPEKSAFLVLLAGLDISSDSNKPAAQRVAPGWAAFRSRGREHRQHRGGRWATSAGEDNCEGSLVGNLRANTTGEWCIIAATASLSSVLTRFQEGCYG